MTRQFVDVVNLNGDASCLSVKSWLGHLEGGKESTLYRWLNLYPRLGRKVSLGATGATLVDIAVANPDSIALLRANPQIFEILGRPYAHDIATTRSSSGFELNILVGLKTIETLLKTRPNWYLPPEFMVTPQQIHTLSTYGYKGLFVLPGRFSERDRMRLPSALFVARGAAKSQLVCAPSKWSLTKQYLSAIQTFDSSGFYSELSEQLEVPQVLWRDGESPFLLPNSVEREEHWLREQPEDIQRTFLSELDLQLSADQAYYYPLHSFQNWMEDLKLFGYLNYIQSLEARLGTLRSWEKAIWLELINSDILSSVEKDDPVIELVDFESRKSEKYVIRRSDRYYEAQELAFMLEKYDDYGPFVTDHLHEHHRMKTEGRIEFLRQLAI